MDDMSLVPVSAVEEAAQALQSVIHTTPLDYSSTFTRLVGMEVFLKLENFQKTGSFKIRGAFNKIRKLPQKDQANGVIAASAGNHAQGVALAARMLGVKATIVMPEGAPITKAAATRGYGAQVILDGENYDDAYKKAVGFQKKTGAVFVHAFDDTDIIAGQGTVGWEILKAAPNIDAILVPIGGGGLISGIAIAAKSFNKDVKIIGVEASGAPSMSQALAGNAVCEIKDVNTIADGIAVKCPGNITFNIVKEMVDDVVTVDDEEIATAMLMLLERSKMVTEASGAVTLAALLAGKVVVPGKSKVACVISGGNVDVNMISQIINRGLAKTGRLVRLRTAVPDRPGALHELLSVVAQLRANVIAVSHDRLELTVPITETEVELTLETRDINHIQKIINELEQSGYLTQLI